MSNVAEKSNTSLVKIVLFGPSGSGKTTAQNIAAEYLKSKNILTLRLNVADPLHAIQRQIFDTLNKKQTDKQDGILLNFLASHYESELKSILENRLNELEAYCANKPKKWIVINSDCRNNMYKSFLDNSFIFIRILTDQNIIDERLKLRNLTLPNTSSEVEKTDRIKVDFAIPNNGTLEEFKNNIIEALNAILA